MVSISYYFLYILRAILFCSKSLNKPGRHKVPFVVMRDEHLIESTLTWIIQSIRIGVEEMKKKIEKHSSYCKIIILNVIIFLRRIYLICSDVNIQSFLLAKRRNTFLSKLTVSNTVKHLHFAACFFRELTISDNFAAI